MEYSISPMFHTIDIKKIEVGINLYTLTRKADAKEIYKIAER